MGSLLIKILGLVDIIAAIIVLFAPLQLPLALKIVLILLLLVKGIPSIFGDITCKFDAVFDLSCAFIILLALAMPDPLKIGIAIVMILKGGTSLL